MTRYDASYDPAAPILTLRVSNPDDKKIEPINDAQALIDSGAFMTAIPENWVARLHLQPVGEKETHGYKEGIQKHRTYFVEIAFQNLSFSVEAMAVNRKNMLLGRDILNQLKLTLNGKALDFDISDP